MRTHWTINLYKRQTYIHVLFFSIFYSCYRFASSQFSVSILIHEYRVATEEGSSVSHPYQDLKFISVFGKFEKHSFLLTVIKKERWNSLRFNLNIFDSIQFVPLSYLSGLNDSRVVSRKYFVCLLSAIWICRVHNIESCFSNRFAVVLKIAFAFLNGKILWFQ